MQLTPLPLTNWMPQFRKTTWSSSIFGPWCGSPAIFLPIFEKAPNNFPMVKLMKCNTDEE